MTARRAVCRARPDRAAALPALLAAGVVVLAAITAGVVTSGPARAAVARPSASRPAAVTVTLDQVAPVSVTDGATLVVTGTVRAASAEADGVQVEVGVGSPVSTRAALVKRLGTTASTGTTGTAGGAATTPTPQDIAVRLATCADCLAGGVRSVPAGSATTFTVSVPLGTRLARGVVSDYPLVVRVTGTAGTRVATTLGEADSWLPYFPGRVAAPLRVSWVWPLDPAPVEAADGSIAASSFPATLGSGGTLGAQLAATSVPGEAPVTYAVEPSLLQAATAVARDGWVRTGSTSPQPASADAQSFLAALRATTTGREVLALPYGDPDAATVVHAGTPIDLTNAVSTGTASVAAALPRAAVLSGYGWVPGTAVDQAELDAYAGGGATTLVLPGGQLAVPDDAPTPTATAVTSLPTRFSPVRGLVTDTDLEALLASAGRDAPTPAMAAQRLLALLAAVVAEAPNSSADRDVVLAVPRGAEPGAAWTRAVLTATTAAGSGPAPWLTAVTLSDTSGDPSAERQPLAAYPADARAAELPASVVTAPRDGVSALRRAVSDASSLFSQQTAAVQTKPLDLALTRAESFAWRADPAGSRALRDDTGRLATAMTRQIGLATASTVTLASEHASIPVTVDNGLGDAVTVTLGLTSTDRTKIEPTTRTVLVPAGQKVRVLLPTAVDRAGTFRATVVMSTPSGAQIGASQIAVHSKAYGALTLGITFGAVGVLALALLVRGVRRVRQGRAAS